MNEDFNIEEELASFRGSVEELYKHLKRETDEGKKEIEERIKLENQDNSHLFNTFDKSEVLDPIELKYVKYFQDNFNSKVDKDTENFSLIYDYYSYGILMYMRKNLPLTPNPDYIKEFNIKEKNGKIIEKNLIKWRLYLLDKNGDVLYKLIDILIKHTPDIKNMKNEDLIPRNKLTKTDLITLNGVEFEAEYIWLSVRDKEEFLFYGYNETLYRHKELVLLAPIQK